VQGCASVRLDSIRELVDQAIARHSVRAAATKRDRRRSADRAFSPHSSVSISAENHHLFT